MVKVLVLPELALAAPQDVRNRISDKLRAYARDNDAVVIAGTYYDEQRFARTPVFGPDWEELGYKIRPSLLEVSHLHGKGMREGRDVLVVETKYGRIADVVCVDVLSDDVQYSVRRLATLGEIDMIAVVSLNPAGWEFLIEMNSLVRRHPVFASITNVTNVSSEPCKDGSEARCYGNSAVFANLDKYRPKAQPSADARSLIPAQLLGATGSVPLQYDQLIAAIAPMRQAMLVYELNLRLLREPNATNAPDQGYPSIRDVHVVDLPAPASSP